MKTPVHNLLLWSAVGLMAARLVGAHSADQPAPRNDGWWQERHKLINQRASEAGEKAELIFIGDSITCGCPAWRVGPI